MLKYAKVINEETKQCEIGTGNPDDIFVQVEKVRTWQETEQQEQVVPAEYDEQGNLVKEETTEIIDVPVEKSETYIETMTVGQFYESIGMTEQDVEQAYNGDWHLTGYAPTQPIEELKALKRAERDNMINSYIWRVQRYEQQIKLGLETTDTEEDYLELLNYIQFLRDIPESPDFPNIELLTFDDWQYAKQQAVN